MDYSSHFELLRLRRERRQAEPPRPRVQSECICRNGGEPDENGWIFVSPVCMVHSPRKAYIGSPRLASAIERREVENAAIAARRQAVVKQKRR